MSYTLFFLIGMPLWLLVATRLFKANAKPVLKMAWAGLAFLAPMLIFGLGALAKGLVQWQVGDQATWPRGFGYFIVALNVYAFFSSFAVLLAFHALHGRQSQQGDLIAHKAFRT